MSHIETDFEDPFSPNNTEKNIEEKEYESKIPRLPNTNKYCIHVDDEILGYVNSEKDAKQFMYKIAHNLKGSAYLQDNYRGVSIDDEEYEDYIEVVGYHAWSPVRIYRTLYRVYYTSIKEIQLPVQLHEE
jgi:hypothetical protein